MKMTIESIEKENTVSKPNLAARQRKLQDDQKVLRKNLAFGIIDKQTFEEFNRDIQQELTVVLTELEGLNYSISNLEESIDKCVDVTKNISKYWVTGDITAKLKAQKLIFPDGLVVDPKKRSYRTGKVNQIFHRISGMTGDTGRQKKDASSKNPDASCVVARTRLERATFGL